MTGERQNFPLARMGTFILPAWIAFVVLMFIPNWQPWRLMSLMLPMLPMDSIAAVVRLASRGLPDLGMLALILLSAVGLGGLLLRLFRLEADAGRRLTLSFGLGLAALSYLTLFVGLAGKYDSAGLAFVFIVLALTALHGGLCMARTLRSLSRRARPGWGDILFFCLLAAVSVFLLAKALRPAVFYDAVAYHLGVPNYYLLEGGIGYIPYDSYSNFPFAAEMLYTLGMFVSGLGAGQLMSPAVFIAATMLVYEFTRSFLPDVPPALPAVFCLLTPAFMENTVQFSNDLMLMYYSVLVLYCFFAYEKDGSRAWMALMGIFTGVCIGTKYIALVSISAPATLAVAYIAYRDRGKGGRAALRTLLAFALPALAVSSPWLIKNLVNTGNPFYPAFYGIFGGADMTAKLYAAHAMNHPSMMEGLKGLVTHPWNVFMAPPSFLTSKYRAASFLGPAVVLFMPVALFVRGVDPVIKRLLVYVLLLFFLWSMAFPLTRYFYPAVAALIVISAYSAVMLYRSFPGFGKFFLAPVAAVCLIFNICLGFFLVDQWTNAWGFDHMDETDVEYLSRRAADGGGVMLQSLPVYVYINENTPPNSRVLIIGDAQHLYIERRHQYTYLSARTPYDVFNLMKGDNLSVYRDLKARGITHIVYNPAELERLSRTGFIKPVGEGRRYMEDFFRSGYVKPVWKSEISGRPVFLFELAGSGDSSGT